MKIRVTIDAQTFDVEVGDLNVRPIPVTVEGDSFMVWPEESAGAHMLQTAPAVSAPAASAPARPAALSSKGAAAPAGAGASGGAKVVTAPIPGVIISIAVKEGDIVKFGDEICVLEAMKMKNAIRANRAGKVAAICVTIGDQVRHGQTLIEYTD